MNAAVRRPKHTCRDADDGIAAMNGDLTRGENPLESSAHRAVVRGQQITLGK